VRARVLIPLLLITAAAACGGPEPAPSASDTPGLAPTPTPVPRPAAPQAPPPPEPLRAWELPPVPAFTPAARVLILHNAHTAWSRKTCAGDPMDALKELLAAEKNRPGPVPPAPFWVGPDSLAPRELAVDPAAPPVSPTDWARFLKSQGVTWLALGRDDRRLGREALEKLARETGLRFVTDVWTGGPFVPCVTETVGALKLAICVLSQDTRDAPAAWARLRATLAAADLRVVFTSGDPLWQKGLATWPAPPDVFVTGGIAHHPHGRLLAPDRIAVAAGADLRHVGELALAPGKTPGTRPLLISELANLEAERERLQLGFNNIARVLARADLPAPQRDVYDRRVRLLRGEWERLATRAGAFTSAAAAHDGPRVSFSLRPLAGCARPAQPADPP
jgi:hypothetical protein